jgi:predicted acylesterase/phospholipase RssA
MKGGITSGIVYPPALQELAQKYRFRQIGGTSAGAIAAAFAAAAEFGSESGKPKAGFEGFQQISDWLGQGTHLLDLFEPSPQIH